MNRKVPHIMRRYKLFIVGAAALGIAGGAAGLALALSNGVPNDQFSAPPVTYAPPDTTAASPTATAQTPAALLQTILSTYQGNAIVDSKVGGPPADFQPTDGSVPTPESYKVGKWAYLTVSAPAVSQAADRAIWEAEIVSGALRDTLHDNGAYLYAAPISIQLPDGQTVDSGHGCCGNVAFDQHFDTPAVGDIPNAIRTAAQSTPLTIKQVDVLNADQPAPAVVATTSADPKNIVQSAETLENTLFGSPPRYEGYYLEVDDANGNPILIKSAAFRAGGGTEWVPDSLRCYSMAYGPSGSSCSSSSG